MYLAHWPKILLQSEGGPNASLYQAGLQQVCRIKISWNVCGNPPLISLSVPCKGWAAPATYPVKRKNTHQPFPSPDTREAYLRYSFAEQIEEFFPELVGSPQF
jgi:hypothetical protein